ALPKWSRHFRSHCARLAPCTRRRSDKHLGYPISISAIRNAESPLQSTETVAIRSEQDEVHAVVVDMPREISLTYADPTTWGDLPMPLQPYEQPAATPVLQFAMNPVKSDLSN